MADPAERTLTDEAIRAELTRLNSLLDQLEAASGPVAETAMTALEQLTEVYGTALARVLALAGRSPEMTAALTADELLHHLFILHGIHPAPVAERVNAALDEVRRYARTHGGDVELAAIEGDVARVRFSGSCQGCHSATATLENLVTDAVLTAAPELAAVEAAPDTAAASPGALIPAESLLHKPVTAAAAAAGQR